MRVGSECEGGGGYGVRVGSEHEGGGVWGASRQ